MAAKLEKTTTPGIYRRGSRSVVVWRHRGVQTRAFIARSPKHAGEGRPPRRCADAEG
jgi:hypothetical protein